MVAVQVRRELGGLQPRGVEGQIGLLRTGRRSPAPRRTPGRKGEVFSGVTEFDTQSPSHPWSGARPIR